MSGGDGEGMAAAASLDQQFNTALKIVDGIGNSECFFRCLSALTGCDVSNRREKGESGRKFGCVLNLVRKCYDIEPSVAQLSSTFPSEQSSSQETAATAGQVEKKIQQLTYDRHALPKILEGNCFMLELSSQIEERLTCEDNSDDVNLLKECLFHALWHKNSTAEERHSRGVRRKGIPRKLYEAEFPHTNGKATDAATTRKARKITYNRFSQTVVTEAIEHLDKMKPDDKSWCAFCTHFSYDGTQIDLAKRHIISKHGPLIKCHICGREVLSRPALKLHLRTHGSQLSCAGCESSFSSLPELVNHETQCDALMRQIEFGVEENSQERSETASHSVNTTGSDGDALSTQERQNDGAERRKEATKGKGDDLINQFRAAIVDGLNLSTFFVRNSVDPTNEEEEGAASNPAINLLFCNDCFYCCREETTLKSHVSSCHPPHGLHHCEICVSSITLGCKGFQSEAELRRHQKCAHHVKFICQASDDCRRLYLGKQGVQNHIKRAHTPGEKFVYQCPSCEKQFSNPYLLKYHRESIHWHVRPLYKCFLCGKEFAQIAHYKEHKELHLSVGRYKCSVCEKAFSQQVGLRQHMAVHTEERPYVCHICSKGFKYKSNLHTHLTASHAETRDHVCDKCGKSFTKKCALKRHELIHLEVKPFGCRVCGRSFSDQSILKRHQRSHEKGRDGVVNKRTATATATIFSPNTTQSVRPNTSSSIVTSKNSSHPAMPVLWQNSSRVLQTLSSATVTDPQDVLTSAAASCPPMPIQSCQILIQGENGELLPIHGAHLALVGVGSTATPSNNLEYSSEYASFSCLTESSNQGGEKSMVESPLLPTINFRPNGISWSESQNVWTLGDSTSTGTGWCAFSLVGHIAGAFHSDCLDGVVSSRNLLSPSSTVMSTSRTLNLAPLVGDGGCNNDDEILSGFIHEYAKEMHT